MVAILVILLFVVYLAFFFPLDEKPKKSEKKSPRYDAQMKKLWSVAQTSMKERKPFRAEKALLTILKFDEKNAAAYNRLGILYAKGQRYEEAVECFEIAQSLDNNPASVHNAGLIYLEIGEYDKAKMAFLQAIQMEGDVPARYIALAKAEEKLGNPKKAIEALENAYELDPSVSTLRQMLAIYETSGNEDEVVAITKRIEEQVIKEKKAKKRRILSHNHIEKPRALVGQRNVVAPQKSVVAQKSVAQKGAVAPQKGVVMAQKKVAPIKSAGSKATAPKMRPRIRRKRVS